MQHSFAVDKGIGGLRLVLRERNVVSSGRESANGGSDHVEGYSGGILE